jgi:ABC-type nickel/cobalt efflux system permease component RcnA
MSGDPVVSAVLLGFVLGLQHATDPDHLVAVATILTRERRFADGIRIGALWGLGHAVTLTLAGGLVVALNTRIRPEVSAGLELVVAAMIVALGGWRLWEALRGLGHAPSEHLLADHDHSGHEAFHSHAHAHGADVHAHPHLHPSRSLLAALDGVRRRAAVRALLVGAVHGLAGTAAVSLLVLATLRSPLAGLTYLVVFALGTLAGMTALTALLAWPLSLAQTFRRAHRGLAVGAGLAAIAFGLFYAALAI